MKRISVGVGSVILGLALTACGGGGDGGAEPVAGAGTASETGAIQASVATPVAKYTEANVRDVARLGVQALVINDAGALNGLAFLGGFLLGGSNDNGGSRTLPVQACSSNGGVSGSLSGTFTKSTNRIGFAVGDSITLVFSNCDMGASIGVLNGTAKVTARIPTANVRLSDFQILFQSEFTDFSILNSGRASHQIGVVNVVLTSNSSLGSSIRFSVPSGQTFTTGLGLANGAGSIGIRNLAGTVFEAFDPISGTSETRKLEGSLTLSGEGTTTTFTVSMPTAMTGNRDDSRRFVASSGMINTQLGDLRTSSNLVGNTVTVSGDTDGNGSLDLVLNTTWASLVGL